MRYRNDSGEWTIRLTHAPDLREPELEAKERAAASLYCYNVEKTGIDDRTPIGAELCSSSGEVFGGLWGRTELGLLFLDMFFLPVRLRGKSQGARLLAAVEEEARNRGCRRAVVETSSFQAPDFYLRHGYEEFGRVEFGIPGHARIFLRKTLR
ncbi:GNAT family N-acetyltransferase [Mesorhizobium sp. M0435]|uniref:GNAT family N-acetyltransferase n=1 Tax=unclassified Mesorhizobium TaxID=325217 RepID=UPI00333E0002